MKVVLFLCPFPYGGPEFLNPFRISALLLATQPLALYAAPMTPYQLNDALDAMEAAAGDDQGKRPGLIEVQTDNWISGLDALQTGRPKTLVDGIRIWDIKVAVGASNTTRVLNRSDAGERGEPFRDLTPKPE